MKNSEALAKFRKGSQPATATESGLLISEIVIGERHREDLGDLSGLMESMQKIGLLHPIVIDGNKKLISGARRLAAAKWLKWTRVPVTVASNLATAVLALTAERDENVERKSFTKIEAASLFNRLLDLEKPEARKRQKEGQSKGGGDRRSEKAKETTASGHGAHKRSEKESETKDRAKDRAAKAAGYGRRTMEKTDAILKSGYEDLIDELKRTDNTKGIYKKLQARINLAAKEKSAAELSAKAKKSFLDVCDIRHCSMSELFGALDASPDCIITDPPYSKEHLPLYAELAKLARDVPLVAVMCGQSYLPEILASMTRHLTYRWTLAYLTPGGQAVQVWKQKVNTFWKPVILFGELPDAWIGDVAKSDVNDNDKRFHGWGQSESGMGDLIDRLTKPGQLVCDPFMGAGTTAVAALRLGRRFIGCDIDEGSVDAAKSRCGSLYA